MREPPLLAVLGASKFYQSGSSSVRALDEATVNIWSGELVGILGPSGSGKTTFLMIAGLLDTPTLGTVSFNGRVVSDPYTDLNKLREFRRQYMGFVFQRPNLIPFLTAVENVGVALEISKHSRRVSMKRARSLLQHFRIEHRANNLVRQLSGGEQQRVAIARALANGPAIIFADEPTANLDSSLGRQIMETFRELADREGVGVCVVTHDLRSVDLFDRQVHLSDGRVVREFTGKYRADDN